MLEDMSLFSSIFEEATTMLFALEDFCTLFATITKFNEIANCESIFDEVSDILVAEALRVYQDFTKENIMNLILFKLAKAFEELGADSANYGLNKCTDPHLQNQKYREKRTLT